MSTPVNQTMNLRAQALTPDQISAKSPELTALRPRSDLAAIELSPKVKALAIQSNVTETIHDKANNPVGSVTFNPEDPQGLMNASEELMKSDNLNDQIKAQELLSRAIRIMNAKIKQAELLHTLAIKALDSLRA